MLEKYFVKPETVDRIRGSWIAGDIEAYVGWLVGHEYSARSVWHRVPVLFAFGEFARARGASTRAELADHVEAFVTDQVAAHQARMGSRRSIAREVRGPIEQMLAVVLPGFEPSGRPQHTTPFAEVAPGFFDYLARERGLRPTTMRGYRYHLGCFEAYLQRIGVESISVLSPALLSAFVVERAAAGLARATVYEEAGVLRVFLRYAHRERLVPSDLSSAVGSPQSYRLGSIPRSISWEEVNRVLALVDRRTEAGRRDFAMLLLLITYGLRSREIAALTLVLTVPLDDDVVVGVRR